MPVSQAAIDRLLHRAGFFKHNQQKWHHNNRASFAEKEVEVTIVSANFKVKSRVDINVS